MGLLHGSIYAFIYTLKAVTAERGDLVSSNHPLNLSMAYISKILSQPSPAPGLPIAELLLPTGEGAKVSCWHLKPICFRGWDPLALVTDLSRRRQTLKSNLHCLVGSLPTLERLWEEIPREISQYSSSGGSLSTRVVSIRLTTLPGETIIVTK